MFRINKIRTARVLFLITVMGLSAWAREENAYRFTIDFQLDHTPVKNQARTGTCWCFATVSFLESEILRTSGIRTDLSEMFIVRMTYPHKAENYVRLHGQANFGQGGQSHDVFDQIRRYGIVPESVYSGQRIGERLHNHGEMFGILESMLTSITKRRGPLTPRWMEAFEAVLNVYLGKPPETFDFEGQSFTPRSFAAHLGIQPDDYVELTSFSHVPFYEKVRLEVPDNWSFDSGYLNVPIDDLEVAADHALKSGYTVAWDGDVSERDFSTRETGYAVVPLKEPEAMSREERDQKITEPVEEKTVTQEMRQETFDNQTTTDDHLMHIVGIAHDQKGTKYYYIKNSGGTERKNEGYVYMSQAYFRLKTIALTVHRDALPEHIRKRVMSN